MAPRWGGFGLGDGVAVLNSKATCYAHLFTNVGDQVVG
jgi:hypothetical protein